MKFLFPLLLAVATMGIAVVIATLYFKIDIKAELSRFLPTEDLPEPPLPEPTIDPAI